LVEDNIQIGYQLIYVSIILGVVEAAVIANSFFSKFIRIESLLDKLE